MTRTPLISLVAMIMLLLAGSNIAISLQEADGVEALMTSARDDDDNDDFCENTYTSESSCNADSRCEWDEEDDPSDDDYPGECEGNDDYEDDEDDDDDDDEDDDDDDDSGSGSGSGNGGNNGGGGTLPTDTDGDGENDDTDSDDDNDGVDDMYDAFPLDASEQYDFAIRELISISRPSLKSVLTAL